MVMRVGRRRRRGPLGEPRLNVETRAVMVAVAVTQGAVRPMGASLPNVGVGAPSTAYATSLTDAKVRLAPLRPLIKVETDRLAT